MNCIYEACRVTPILCSLILGIVIAMQAGLAASDRPNDEPPTRMSPILGDWNASLKCPGGDIRFELRLDHAYDHKSFVARIVNGSEVIKIPNVEIGKDSKFTIDFSHYDSKIEGQFDAAKKMLVGTWAKRRSDDEWAKLDFSATVAKRSQKSRVIAEEDGYEEFAGRWKVDFSSSEDSAVAEFKILGMLPGDARDRSIDQFLTLEGTFLTTTGDYRYLHGARIGKGKSKAFVSCFDGAHAFLFKMELQDDGSLKGDFWSSDRWHETWTAVRDENAKLPDAFQESSATDVKITSLSFPDLEGVMTSIGDKKFSGKARLIYVFGSWCPNCHDAAAYFSHLKKVRFRDKDLSILGLAFEVTNDPKRNAQQVKKYLARHESDYPVLIAGPADKKLATKAFPVLDRVRSYPTTIFVDEDDNITAVHTGFSGPATGAAYVELKEKFESEIEKLLKK